MSARLIISIAQTRIYSLSARGVAEATSRRLRRSRSLMDLAPRSMMYLLAPAVNISLIIVGNVRVWPVDARHVKLDTHSALAPVGKIGSEILDL